MIRWNARLALVLCGLATLICAGPEDARAQSDEPRKSFILTTATTGGTFYPVGVAIATVTKTQLAPTTGISLTAISSAGSAENISLLKKNEAQFAILQGIYGAWTWRGEGPQGAEGQWKGARAITALWPNVEHFIVPRRLAPTGTMADLSGFTGKRFAIGRRNSGAEGSGRHILNALGIDADGLSLSYLGYGPSADALINGTVDGVNIPAGPPVSAVTRAFAARGKDLVILSFTDDQLDRINEGINVWYQDVIPAGTYPGQDTDIPAAAQPNFLAVRADMDAEVVYQITQSLYTNLALLNAIHPATKAMSLEKAFVGLPMPLHPGAARFFREQGLTPPDETETP